MLGYLQTYSATKDKTKFLKDIQNLPINDRASCLAILGGEYLAVNDYDNGLKYLLDSNNLFENKIATYNLGYLYESLKDEPKMLKYYQLSMKYYVYQAYNQLGKYYLDKEIVPQLNVTPESLLQIAKNNNIIQAFRNLIILYKNQKNYVKELNTIIDLYLKTQNLTDIMELLLLVLNKGDYFRYIYLLKKLPVSSDSLASLNNIYSNNLVNSECTICYESEKCVKTTCNHLICTKCIDKIIGENPVCPYCRKSLFVE